MLIAILAFLGGLLVLLLSARYFTVAAERIGLALNLSPFLVGVLIVAVGTSLPELVSAIIATSADKTEIVVGNVIGANVSNIFLILGITTLFAGRNIYLGDEYIAIDMHFMLGSAVLVGLFLWDGTVELIEGLILLLGFVFYQGHIVQSDKPEKAHEMSPILSRKDKLNKLRWKDISIVVIASVGVFFGARFTVDGIVDIATYVHMDETYISLTALSLGTTLPELSVSIAAARQGKAQIAVGNILGSCIFNSFVVMGVSSMIRPVIIPPHHMSLLLAFLLIASLFFYLLAQDKKISRWEGMLFLVFYLAFLLEVGDVI